MYMTKHITQLDWAHNSSQRVQTWCRCSSSSVSCHHMVMRIRELKCAYRSSRPVQAVASSVVVELASGTWLRASVGLVSPKMGGHTILLVEIELSWFLSCHFCISVTVSVCNI